MADWPYSSAKWQRLRKRKLSVDPLCYPCELRGRVVAATTVDHVIAVSSGGPVFPALDGLMSMCARCHNEKTNAMDRPDRGARGRRFKGFDVHGNPIDPTDAWHGEGGLKDQRRAAPRPAAGTRIDLFNRGLRKRGSE